jgi:hypothetical protein
MKARRMSKFILLLFASTLLALRLGAQGFEFTTTPPEEVEKEKEVRQEHGYLGASIGVAAPLGLFANNDFHNLDAGYAQMGYAVNFMQSAVMVTKHFGIGVNWNRLQFGFDHVIYKDPYDIYYPEYRFEMLSSDPWLLHTVLVNGIVSIPGKWFSYDIRMGVGWARVIRPEILMEGYEWDSGALAFSWFQASNNHNDVILGFGNSLRFHALKDIDLMLSWDYQRMHSTLTIEHVYGRSLKGTEDLEQSFEFLTTSVGLALRL